MMAVRRLGRVFGILALASLVSVTALGDPPDPRPSVRYTVRTDSELESMRVHVCFEGEPPATLGPGIRRADRALVEATGPDGQPLPRSGGDLVLRNLPRGACIDYVIDLEAALRATRFGGRFAEDLVTSQGAWLWRDRARVFPGGALVRFELPAGLRASTPWPERPGGWQYLERSAFRNPSFVAFGRAAPRTIERQGVRARLLRLGVGWNVDEAEHQRWLEEAIDGVATVQGRFPVGDLLVMLVPSSGRSMGFGMVRRGGGYSAAFVVGTDAGHADMRSHWVTWHELSHLQLPALPQEDAWLYEGIATYYQEVLPARLGIQSGEEAWAQLVDGFDRGEVSRARGTLAEAAATMFETRSFQRVYWAGTVFGLEADVALRRRHSSLDAAITRSARRWRGDLSLYSSRRVCAAWDRTVDASVLRPMRDRYAERHGFPGTRRLLDRLGVRTSAGGVELRDAELSDVRDAIMSGGATR